MSKTGTSGSGMSGDPNAVLAWDWNAPGKIVQGLIPGQGSLTQDYGKLELLRLQKMILDIEWFYKTGIQGVIKENAKTLRDDLQREAPYDEQELDDYHMQDHMTDKPIENGRQVESEAPYSGALEYGTAYHGVQYVFFRPATEKTWKKYKEDCIRDMTRIVRK